MGVSTVGERGSGSDGKIHSWELDRGVSGVPGARETQGKSSETHQEPAALVSEWG